MSGGDAFPGQFVVKDLLDVVLASAASAACLRVVGDLFDCSQVVEPYHLADLALCDLEALADDASFALLVGEAWQVVFGVFLPDVGKCGAEGLHAHHGAVHLGLGERPQVVGDILVGEL